MTTDTLIGAGINAARVRDWIGRCKDLPPPPLLRVPYARIDPAAIDAAIARGTSSLDRSATMPKATIQTAPRVPCVACDRFAERAHPAHAICSGCAATPDLTRERLTQRIARIQDRIVKAAQDAQDARDALPPSDVPKWDKISAARLAVGRSGRFSDTATEATRTWLRKVQKAIDTKASTQVSDAIRRVWLADEIAYWAISGASDEERRARIALEQFDACIEALAQ
jgi:hypothetical protein